MNGFEKRREDKKNDIKNAAFELFNLHGIEGVKITDIAEKANVSKVSIYNYFGSKEELAKQVLYDFMDKSINEFKELVTNDIPFEEKFTLIYQMNMMMSEKLNGEVINFFTNSPQFMLEFLGAYFENNIKPIFIDFIEQGKREGMIEISLATESILMYIEAFGNILARPMDMKKRQDLAKLFLYGFKGK